MLIGSQDVDIRRSSRLGLAGAIAFTMRSLFGANAGPMKKPLILPPQDELYNSRKAAQVVAFFVLKQGGRVIELVKAIKLVYLADRESLRRCGAPILHEPRVALAQGPVNQTTLDYVDGNRLDPEGWSRFIAPRVDKRTVSVQPGFVEADLDEFSRAELDVLESVWKRHGRFKGFQIVDWTHKPSNVPEWAAPQGSRKSRPIPLEQILRAVNFPDPQAALERLEEQRSVERAFRRIQ